METRDDETAIVNKAESENSSFFVKANWNIDLPEGNINTSWLLYINEKRSKMLIWRASLT